MGLGVQVSVGLGFRGLWFLGAEASARELRWWWYHESSHEVRYGDMVVGRILKPLAHELC